LQQPTLRIVVMGVRLHMVGEVIDPFGEDCDLDLRRSGVRVVLAVGLDDARLVGRCQSVYLLDLCLTQMPLASRTPAFGQTRVYPTVANR
jgi:hypothetical protein